jgi:hypothetical protein
LIVLRWKEPQRVRPFRVPLHIQRVPVLPPAGLAICLALITQFEAIVYGVTAGAVAFGVGVWWLSRPAQGRHTGTHA